MAFPERSLMEQRQSKLQCGALKLQLMSLCTNQPKKVIWQRTSYAESCCGRPWVTKIRAAASAAPKGGMSHEEPPQQNQPPDAISTMRPLRPGQRYCNFWDSIQWPCWSWNKARPATLGLPYLIIFEPHCHSKTEWRHILWHVFQTYLCC